MVDDCGDCKVRDIFAVGFSQYGIWVRGSSFLCEIRGCTLAGNKVANLYLDHLERGYYGNFLPNLVTNCIVYGGGKAIECNRTIVLNIIAFVVYQTKDVAYYVGNTSMEVGVKVFSENPLTGQMRNTTKAYLTFVALDDQGKPTSVEKINPQTDDEKRRYQQAAERIKYRKQKG